MKTLSRFSLLSLVVLFVGLFAGTACSHYQLGTGAKLGFRKLFVAPVSSEVMLAQARTVIGLRLREDFLRDPRIELVGSREEAEAVLEVNLKNFKREAVVAQKQDTGLGRKFALTLTAECTLTKSDGTKVFTKQLIHAQREDYNDLGQNQAETETLPLIAQDLSNHITHAVLDRW
jgi:hypothetical protein